jgi:pentose-5-phosphate-3-epimerase
MKKYIIYPSLLALADRKNDWKQETQKVASLSTGIHYDIGDGEFVPSLMLDPADIPLA